MRLIYDAGTIVATNQDKNHEPLGDGWLWDERSLNWRAPALHYREILTENTRNGIDVIDECRAYEALDINLTHDIVPRVHQAAALKAWMNGGRQGVVELPTGAGKTILAVLAVVRTGRSALIVVPTIDLMHQWIEVFTKFTDMTPSALGGGSHDIGDLTISTYDSAAIHFERLGNRFGMVVFDECHHLPAPQYQNIALASLAPFRLGLSATVERADGKEERIFELVGPLVYESHIHDMVDDVLAPYDVVNIEVELTPEERAEYKEARETYLAFVRQAGVNFGSPHGWMDFVRKAARMPGGRQAMRAYRRQKRLAQASSAKIDELWGILGENYDDRVIVFTDDNAMAYRIGREFCLPVLTHQTKIKERRLMLEAFREGELPVIVTSKVLNEGVDVPDARVGVVISGSGAVREHVQRLGRILRHQPGKRAVLYELVSKGTSETNVNRRRRQHHAYQRSPEV